MEDKSNEIRKIQEDISLSGFPLEINVSSILEKNGWTVRNQRYYIDEDEGKTRTIDILAYKAFFENFGNNDRLNITLVVECKKSIKPWVFFTTQKEKEVVSTIGYIKYWAYPKLENFTWLNQSHYAHDKFNEKAVISYEPFKGGKGREILEATRQVTKALNFQIEEFKRFQQIAKRTTMPMKPIFFLFPIICFDGNLYEYKLKNGVVKISPTDYLQYSVHERKGMFLVDVIKKEFLAEYLRIMNEEVEVIRHSLK